MHKCNEEPLKTELSLLAQENCNMKMQTKWQNKPQHTVIALVLHTSGSAISQTQDK